MPKLVPKLDRDPKPGGEPPSPRPWPLWRKTEMYELSQRFHGGREQWSLHMDEDLRERLKDPHYLPTFDEVLKIENYTAYGDELGDHEILNREYIAALADRLIQSAGELAHEDGSPVRIVEVAAGTGRLTYFLKKEIERRIDEKTSPAVEIVATTRQHDPDPDEDLPSLPVLAPVEFMLADDAIEQYEPDIVIASWPTLDHLDEWVKMNPSVKELILLGLSEACHISSEESDWIPISGFVGEYDKKVQQYQVGRADDARQVREFIQGTWPYKQTGTYRYRRIDTMPLPSGVRAEDMPPGNLVFKNGHYRVVTDAGVVTAYAFRAGAEECVRNIEAHTPSLHPRVDIDERESESQEIPGYDVWGSLAMNEWQVEGSYYVHSNFLDQNGNWLGGGLIEFFPDEASARVCQREILRHDPRYQAGVEQYFRS